MAQITVTLLRAVDLWRTFCRTTVYTVVVFFRLARENDRQIRKDRTAPSVVTALVYALAPFLLVELPDGCPRQPGIITSSFK